MCPRATVACLAIVAYCTAALAHEATQVDFNCSGYGTSAASLQITLQPFSYAVQVGAAAWLTGGDVHVRSQGEWYSAALNSSMSLNSNSTQSGADSLGAYTELVLGFTLSDAARTPIQAAFRCYTEGLGTLQFLLSYPEGIAGASSSSFPPTTPTPHLNATTAVGARFPVFAAGPATALGSSLGYYEWYGDWASEESHSATNGLLGGYISGQASGPLLLFDGTGAGTSNPSKCNALVMSPRDHFRSVIFSLASPTANASDVVLGAGPSSYIDAYPPGFTSSIVLYASNSGINDAIAGWGHALQLAYNTSRVQVPDDSDFTQLLSYFTDNGAMLSCRYWASVPANTTATDVLTAMQQYFELSNIPVRLWQLDPWWLPCDTGVNGGSPMDFVPRPDLFPNGGLVPLADAGFKFMLYTTYWSTAVASGAFANYSWVISTDMQPTDFPPFLARIAANESRAFYADLLSRAARWGMVAMETDWVMRLTQPYVDFQTQLGSLDEWYRGLDGAMLDAGMAWQQCLSWASDVMAAVGHPSITHIRVSIDDEPQHFPNRWRIGATAALHAAMRVRPFTDVVLTSLQQPFLSSEYPFSNGLASYPELAVLVAALSAGPVGIGDELGYSNATLIASTCAADGVLLRPSAPLTFLDLQYTLDAAATTSGSPVPGPQGTSMQAHSYIPSAAGGGAVYAFPSLLIVDAAVEWNISAADFSPPLPLPSTPGGAISVPYAYAYTLGKYASLSILVPDSGYVYVPWSPGYGALSAACSTGGPAAGCVGGVLTSQQSLQIATGPGGGTASPFTHDVELLSLSPVLAGWALLGEVSKAVRVSPDRFLSLQPAQGSAGIQFTLRVAAGETVQVAVMAPPVQPGGLIAAGEESGGPLDGATVVAVSVKGSTSSRICSVSCVVDSGAQPGCSVASPCHSAR